MRHNMKRSSVRTIVITLFAITAFSTLVLWRSIAQEPPLPTSQGNIQQSIRKALQGETETASPEEPLLQDVLDLIKRQGSILDGSMLDQAALQEQPTATAIESEATYHAAEALLRASRLLAAIPAASDSNRKALIRDMRSEASRLMQAAGDDGRHER